MKLALWLAVAFGMALLAACDDSEDEAAPTRLERAPIDAVDIRIAESAPPQYFVDVTSGLPSGCARFERYDVDRQGATITITVLNRMPSGDDVICTAIYGMVEHHIPLGSTFDSGRTYTVRVNDETRTFTAH